MEIIHAYTRKQALADGVLVDAGELAKEAGFKHPVALTQAAWETCVTVPDAADWQDETGRLWDVLTMMRLAAKQGGELIKFTVLVQNDSRCAKPIHLKAICSAGDNAEPVITVMLPEED